MPANGTKMVKSPAETSLAYDVARQAVAALSPADRDQLASDLAIPANLRQGLDLAIHISARAAAAQMITQPSIQEVRRALAVISGSLSGDIIAER